MIEFRPVYKYTYSNPLIPGLSVSQKDMILMCSSINDAVSCIRYPGRQLNAQGVFSGPNVALDGDCVADDIDYVRDTIPCYT